MAMVRQLLDSKGYDVLTVRGDDTVFYALQVMAEKNVGAVLVMDNGLLAGIFTERDYSRRVILRGRSSPVTPIADVMQTQLVCVGPDDSVDRCMGLMTEKHIRHLPVLEDGKLIGILSIGDLVKSVIADQQFTIEQLETYIMA